MFATRKPQVKSLLHCLRLDTTNQSPIPYHNAVLVVYRGIAIQLLTELQFLVFNDLREYFKITFYMLCTIFSACSTHTNKLKFAVDSFQAVTL